jgi:predicted aspartyl protease
MPSNSPIVIGYFNNAGHPVLKIEVFGLDPKFKQEFEVMIDTGFTGFLMMPIMSAFPLGLTLCGTMNYTFADGSSSAKLVAIGAVIVANENPLHGVIVLEPNDCTILLGMDFLKKAKRCLTVSDKGVLLADEDLVTQVVDAVQAHVAAATSTATS